MYDDIIDLAMDQQLLSEIVDAKDYKYLPIWKELAAMTEEQITNVENSLKESTHLQFNKVFDEEIGFFFFKLYLELEHSVDKAVFLQDVKVYKTIQNEEIRKKISKKIYQTFCEPEFIGRRPGVSVFANRPNDNHHLTYSNAIDSDKSMIISTRNNVVDSSEITEMTPSIHQREVEIHLDSTGIPMQFRSLSNTNNNKSLNISLTVPINKSLTPNKSITLTNSVSPFLSDNTNAIGIFGKCVKKLRNKIDCGDSSLNIFDKVSHEILTDLRLDVYPRFLKSEMYKMYLQCKYIELSEINNNSFHKMRMLGRGAFGSVFACKKLNTGKLYAMKQIDKKRIQATNNFDSLISERNLLSKMDSRFVTSLKYAFMDDNKLYLVMDLMTGGDLKYHLNHAGTFEQNRARFYAAQILLGLEHIHSKGIIYRDLKLENVLVDSKGHCKISDFGLSVYVSDGLVRGYAGTPGYTAPEVVLTQYYNKEIDFFSLGVVIYRSLYGKKPFAKEKIQQKHHNKEFDKIRKATVELDRNVVEMLPSFATSKFNSESRSLLKGLLCKNPKYRLGSNGYSDITEHPWFDCIDWSLLATGYLKSPFIPTCNQIHAEQTQCIGQPPNDEKYSKIKISQKFNEQLQQFPFKSSKVIQSEICTILKNVQIDRRRSGVQLNHIELYEFPEPTEKVVEKNHCLGCVII